MCTVLCEVVHFIEFRGGDTLIYIVRHLQFAAYWSPGGASRPLADNNYITIKRGRPTPTDQMLNGHMRWSLRWRGSLSSHQVVQYQYPLHRISYCADDKSDKRMFSFIAKEADSEIHNCFVFDSEKCVSDSPARIAEHSLRCRSPTSLVARWRYFK